MALSGAIETKFHNNGYTFKTSWSATQNIVNNTSTISFNTYLKSNGQVFSKSVNVSLSYNQEKLLLSGEKTIYHGADGKKSFSISSYLAIDVTLSSTKYPSITIPAKEFALNDIPRKSDIN